MELILEMMLLMMTTILLMLIIFTGSGGDHSLTCIVAAFWVVRPAVFGLRCVYCSIFLSLLLLFADFSHFVCCSSFLSLFVVVIKTRTHTSTQPLTHTQTCRTDRSSTVNCEREKLITILLYFTWAPPLTHSDAMIWKTNEQTKCLVIKIFCILNFVMFQYWISCGLDTKRLRRATHVAVVIQKGNQIKQIKSWKF